MPGTRSRPIPRDCCPVRVEDPDYLTPDQFLADQSVQSETLIGARPAQPSLYRRAGEHASVTRRTGYGDWTWRNHIRRALLRSRVEVRCVMPPAELVKPTERWFPRLAGTFEKAVEK
jgi:hypothetical protein